MGQLTSKQTAVLHVAKKQLGLSDDDYRAILSRQAGVASSRELDLAGFLKVVKHFTALGFRFTWTKRTFGNRADMATPSQVELIRRIWAEFSESGEEAGLNAWLDKFHHVSALRFVDAKMASKVIYSLKAMKSRKKLPRKSGF